MTPYSLFGPRLTSIASDQGAIAQIELKRKLRTVQVKVLESQVNSRGKDASKQQDMKTTKQIRILENRLDHALVRFNEALAVNKQLREEIDHLRRERVVFDNINRLECEMPREYSHSAHVQ